MASSNQWKNRLSRQTVFIDLLLVIVVVMITLIAPKIPPTIEVKPTAIITVDWSEQSTSDVDTHVATPSNTHISYVAKDDGDRIFLTRDDLGNPWGQTGQNTEVVEIYQWEDGKYRISVRMFAQKDHLNPQDVHVRVVLTETYDYIVDRVVVLAHQKHTIPIATITIKDGNIVDVDTDPQFRTQSGGAASQP